MSNEQRDQRGRFAPGHKGLGGRKPGWAGLAKLIHDATDGGAALIQHALTVFEDVNVSPDRRWAAMLFLADRGWGKPASTVDVQVSAGPSLPADWALMSPSERMRFLDAAAPPLLGAGDP